MRRAHLTISSIILAVVLSCAATFADPPSKEWGSVTKEELATRSFAADSNASAVILFDVADASFDPNYDLVFHRHRRVKILKTEGYKWGTAKVDCFKEFQTLKEVEGQTLSLAPDGSILRQELREEDVFTDDLGEKWKRSKFTLPALSPGCIIEYRYTVISTSPHYLPDWSFQNEEPTLWSEYEIRTPNVFAYASVSQGYHSFTVQTSEQVKESFTGPTGRHFIDVSHQHWVMENLPALRDEPFITTLDDYRDRVMFQLSGVAWPGETPRKILQTWSKVAEDLWAYWGFGGQLGGSGSVRKVAEAVVAGLTDPTSRLVALYDYVRTNIQWSDRHEVVTLTSIEDVLEKRSGNSAEVNLLLTAMLREVGIPASPVLLSTRSHGIILDIYPILSQFNTVVCRATIGAKPVILDATDRHRPWNLLPNDDLNHRGFLVDEDRSEWVDVEPTAGSNTVVVADVSVDSAGAMSGKVQMKFHDYAAVRQRSGLEGEKRAEFINDLMKASSLGLSVDSFSIANLDSVSQPFAVEASVSSPNYAQALEEFLYFNPMTVSRSMENPFKRPERLFPVDYSFPRNVSYNLNLKIPPGYTIKEHPKDLTVQLPMNGGVYQRQSMVSGNVYMLSSRFELTQISFPPRYYPNLRGFYDRIVAMDSEQLVLQKDHSVPAAAPAVPAKSRGKKK